MFSIWQQDLNSLPSGKHFLVSSARVLESSYRARIEHKSGLLAAGLTFVTLMALVPLLAFLFALLNALGQKEEFEVWLQGTLSDLPPAYGEVFGFVLDVVENVRLEGIGAPAILILIYSVLSLLGKIEGAFNLIWKAKKGRNLARRFADYMAILFLVPLLVLLATGLTTLFSMERVLADLGELLPWLAWLLESGLSFLPLVFLCIAATLVFKVMPNVKVRWMPAAIAGFLTGFLLHLVQWAFGKSQVGIAQANLIYGSLAFLPLFLIYLHVSWSLVIWGGEIAYSVQNLPYLKPPWKKVDWSPARRRSLGLTLIREALERFEKGRSLSLAEFSARTGGSRARVEELAALLVRGGFLHRVKLGEGVVPALPGERMAVREVLLVLDGEEDALPPEGGHPEDRERLKRAREGATSLEGHM